MLRKIVAAPLAADTIFRAVFGEQAAGDSTLIATVDYRTYAARTARLLPGLF